MAGKKQPNNTAKSSYQIAFRALSDLQPYAANARTHSPEQVAEIAASIAEFGWTNPILADGAGMIVAGHGRRLAAIAIYDKGGLIRLPSGEALPAGVVPVIDCTGWTAKQKRAYVLADNQLALKADWDLSLLRQEIDGLREDGVNLEAIGFAAKDIRKILANRIEKEDDIPEPPKTTTTKRGDMWRLGDHILRCGDSTDANDVARLLGGIEPHLMVTDPPYGVEYDPAWRRTLADNPANLARGKVMNDDRADWREAWALFPGDVAYVWHSALHAATVAESLEAAGFAIRSQIIWDKTRLVIGRGDYHWAHEPAWYAVRKGKTGHWSGDRKQSTVWAIEHRRSETGHGTQKPVECMRRPMLNNADDGDTVYDPFCGSGTSIIAAETSGRRCFAMEISPIYCDVIVRRWEEFVGKAAENIGG